MKIDSPEDSNDWRSYWNHRAVAVASRPIRRHGTAIDTGIRAYTIILKLFSPGAVLRL